MCEGVYVCDFDIACACVCACVCRCVCVFRDAIVLFFRYENGVRDIVVCVYV